MSKKIKPWHQEDDQIPALLQRDIEDFEEYDLKNFKFHHQNNGEEAKHRLDLGRNCPRCAGRLTVKEKTEAGHLMVRCMSCNLQVFAEDLDRSRETSDALYRDIPLSLMLRYKRT